MIRIEHVHKSYGNKKALDDVTLHIEKGHVYGVVGENGAGKTTLFRCLVGLDPYEGRIAFDLASDKIRPGFLPTEPYFFQKITGREYIRLLCNARKVPVGDLDARNIFDLPLDRYASTYSTGMKKKLALLAVLMQENDFLILDEPFNGVDIQSNLIITGIIHRLKELGKTVLVSSHIFSTLRDNCDEIFLLHEGRLLKKVGRPEFDKLEKDMQEAVTGNKIERLNLR